MSEALEGRDQLERNLRHSMPRIVTSAFPALAAAQANTQIEFDRTYRTIVTEEEYQGKNLAFIAGDQHRHFPPTGTAVSPDQVCPWAAYIQTRDGEKYLLEQEELAAALFAQSRENPDKIEMSNAIQAMEGTPEIKIELEEK